ncbi:GNAT family N-acetyltransferase [Litorihabitans aurantiacus]|uniref:GCN5 family N-acetyltransferase n=1 Tax=Litorihabitans aurantiacus TaxID=1930061 RepID=A0AA37XGJ9_9MICO|nr:GNAT family protein [Litorihabitans aurantiacus]GMA33283.1 GCN5 family N-acetyltransferase [Litorihabitans aurantiacus]
MTTPPGPPPSPTPPLSLSPSHTPIGATPILLTGDLVTLRPLQRTDRDALAAAVDDGGIWRLEYTRVPSPAGMAQEIERRLALAERGTMVPFTTVRRGRDGGPDEVIGMTTYCNIDQASPRLEIGFTWNAASAQRTGTNTESKLLLLGHAFEVLGCIAVELRTDARNTISQRAIERIGAHRDGVLRRHTVMPDGYVRDTVVYSITAPEWPGVRSHLRGLLAR